MSAVGITANEVASTTALEVRAAVRALREAIAASDCRLHAGEDDDAEVSVVTAAVDGLLDAVASELDMRSLDCAAFRDMATGAAMMALRLVGEEEE